MLSASEFFRIRDDNPYQLLAAVDSLELFSKTSTRDELEGTFKTFDDKSGAVILDPVKIPTYMNEPKKPQCSQMYAKMTENDWNSLKMLQLKDDKSQQRSSVQFCEFYDSSRVSKQGSKRNSILKSTPLPSTAEVKKTIQPQNNALAAIHDKCREALSGMKMEEVLMMLCKSEAK